MSLGGFNRETAEWLLDGVIAELGLQVLPWQREAMALLLQAPAPLQVQRRRVYGAPLTGPQLDAFARIEKHFDHPLRAH